MPRETVVSKWCERIAEACWLLALTLVPIYFNLYSARHFEPDKAAVLRSLALVAVTAVLVRWLDGLMTRAEPRTLPADSPGAPVVPPAPLWRRFVAIPLAVPALVYALVFLFTTATSVVPATSFWGSYQRMQGTYTNLSYMLLFVAIVAVVRRRAQLERIVTMTLAASMAVAGYGVLQHFGLDPLPWRGDVITRVASTMGNSIFVAAYMIMVVPLALYRLFAGLGEARSAPEAGATAQREWLWTLTRGLIFSSGILLLLAMMKFGAVIRVVDYRYWWLLPGAVVCATAIWWLLTTPLDRPEGTPPVWPGLLTLGYLLIFGVQFGASSGGGLQLFATDGTAVRAQDWWLWLLVTIFALTAAYGLALTLPKRLARPTALGLRLEALAAGFAALLLCITIFFTQSRGPWIGLGVGLFVFFSLILLQALRRARAAGVPNRVRLFTSLLAGWVGLTVALGGFLIFFNLSSATWVEQLRNVPYVGRMGRLLEVDAGTGLVRRLIWVGDEHAGGAVALITSDPLRAVIGWGPESMFVAFNPFYPPSLANIEARGASPDRSHQALLDELVTKGVLGLASYLFLIFSFVGLAWRLLARSVEWRWQVFFVACLSAISATFVESLTGIPIVSTLMMFWVILGLTVTGGAIAGHYRLSLVPEPAIAPVPVEPPTVAGSASAKGGQTARRKGAPRGNAPRTPARPAPGGQSSAGPLLAYGLVALVTAVAVLLININPIRADMRFQQGQSLSERSGLSADGLVRTMDEYLQTVRLNPREDFYYLNLGRVLMSLAEVLRSQGVDPGAPKADARVDSLLRLNDQDQLVGFIQRSSPNELMSYAEAVLLHAHDLNPRNKDHYANLGRLNSFWYQWSNDPERLAQAQAWYEQVAAIAPQDVTLINERAGVATLLGEYMAAKGDQAQADRYFAQARELLDQSQALDPRYADTYVRIGDLARKRSQDDDAAVEAYVQAIGLSGQTVANAIEGIADSLSGRPDLILKLRDAYAAHAVERGQALDNATVANPALDRGVAEAELALLHTVTGLLSVRAGDVEGSIEPYREAVALQPTNQLYSRNYALVLSDTLRHDQAVAETQRLISLLRGQPGGEQAVADAQQLITIFEQARPE